jgi:pimeloyl-ACP methyl ester carboxylesterase
MAELMPNSRLAVLPGAGHLLPIEAPEAMTEAVRGWLKGSAAR